MKSCFHCRETANCLIIQVFTLMKHYSMGLEHGVQPNYHPSTHAVKSDYSLASQWVVPTSLLFSNHQMRMTAVLTPPPLPLAPPPPPDTHFKNMKIGMCCMSGKRSCRERWGFYELLRTFNVMYVMTLREPCGLALPAKASPCSHGAASRALGPGPPWNKPSTTRRSCLNVLEFHHLRTAWWESL